MSDWFEDYGWIIPVLMFFAAIGVFFSMTTFYSAFRSSQEAQNAIISEVCSQEDKPIVSAPIPQVEQITEIVYEEIFTPYEVEKEVEVIVEVCTGEI